MGLAHHGDLARPRSPDDVQANDCDHDLVVLLAVLLRPGRNHAFVQPAVDDADLASSRHPHRRNFDRGFPFLCAGAGTEAAEGCSGRRDLVVLRGLACWAAATYLGKVDVDGTLAKIKCEVSSWCIVDQTASSVA